MATPTATVTDFCARLTRSQLIPANEVAALHAKWKADPAASDADVDAFRKFLVSRRYLTEYQAALVQRGRTDGFYVGGYLILDRIGKGRSAGVYLAVHASGQVVALKVLPASKARNPHTLARFQREGRLLTQLHHPNVVRAYQLGATSSVHYIVMEHLEGETLDEVLDRRKQLPAPEAARLVYQALHGLQHLHEKRMIHRDLKPANLMVVPPRTPGQPDTTLDGTVKILDIGLGREVFDEDSVDTHDEPLTADGAVLGTPAYLAPEQARDARGADIRADVYSLGCVLYHLLSGRPPFSGPNVMATIVKHSSDPVPPVTQFAPAVPPGLVAVLDRMLAKDPADRYQTPAEAAEAVRPFLPPDAPGASESVVLPAFEKWLAAEAELEREEAAAAAKRPPRPPKPAGGEAATPGGGPVAVQIAGPGAAPRRPAVPDSLPEIDVELVARPGTAEAAALAADGPRVVAPPRPRPLYDLDRRDFVMLALGAGGVIAAILGGFVAARAMRQKVEGE